MKYKKRDFNLKAEAPSRVEINTKELGIPKELIKCKEYFTTILPIRTEFQYSIYNVNVNITQAVNIDLSIVLYRVR